MPPIIEVKNLVYEYPRKRALRGVSFVIEPGTVVAMVGPNGAGKTTLLRCMAALDAPYSGTVRIAGIDSQDDPRAVHSMVGYLSDFFGLYDDLTVREALTYMALVQGVPASSVGAEVNRICDQLKLNEYVDLKASNLSRGLRQRLGIGQAAVHRPSILLLDEPAAGLDPEARVRLSELILTFKREGMAVVVSSHILSELEDYSDRMLMLQGGIIIADELVKSAGRKDTKSRFKISLIESTKDISAILAASGAAKIEQRGWDAFFEIPSEPEAQAEFLRKIVAAGCRLNFFGEAPKSMEDVYLSKVSETR